MGAEREQIVIHPLTEAMLHATDSVVMAAYGVPHSRKGSLRRYLDLQPEGSFVAFLEETIVGFGAVIDYGRFAYVGLMSVHPALQKRGVGGALLTHCLSWADKRHCPTILLDATPAGFPLYQSCGFVEEDQTMVFQQTLPVLLPPHFPGTVTVLLDEGFSEVVSFDTSAFGAERSMLLAAYRADDPQRVLVVRDASRHISGYLMAQTRVLGPWVARTAGMQNNCSCTP